MKKLVRLMDEPLYWKDYTEEHSLKIKNFKSQFNHQPFFDDNNQEVFSSFYEISFSIFDDNRLLSSVNQKIHPSTIEDQSLNNQYDIHIIQAYLKSFDCLSYSQALFLTYLNEEESRLFEKEVGESILILKKKVYNHPKLILYEEELAQIDAYVFKEEKF